MVTIGGFGGVRLELLVSEEETYSVTFPRTRAYCSQPVGVPTGWSKKTINGKSLQRLDGYWLNFIGLFENVQSGDENNIRTLMKILARSGRTGISIKLYPKWDSGALRNTYYMVKCISNWSVADINNKKAVAQRIKELEFESDYIYEEVPYFDSGARRKALMASATHHFAVNKKLLIV